ncbi:MAG: hypothetical protein IPK70_14330 [Flavobacteriales bacterium]|jgi:hypothetical protein|nr:hypothetical protein [Flavobacteriales bacterium]
MLSRNHSRAACAFFTALCGPVASAQFFYAGLGAHLSVQNPESIQVIEALDSRTAFVALEASPFLGYRISQHFAVGLSARLPMINSKRLTSFGDDEYEYGNPYRVVGEYENGEEMTSWSWADQTSGRAPEAYGVTIRPAALYAAHLMLIMHDRSGFFVEARAAYGGFREVFAIYREGSAGVEPLNETVKARKGGLAPGIGIGIMPHVGEGSFIRLEGGFDFLLLSTSSGFRYELDSQPNGGDLQTLTLRSTLERGSMFRFGFTYGRRF